MFKLYEKVPQTVVNSDEKPPEMSPFDKIIYESTPDEFDDACRLNKSLAALRKSNSAAVTLGMIKKYNVDYTDKGNLIYMDINFDDIYNSKTDVYDMEKIYDLFLKYYKMEEIDCSGKGITSLFILPKLKKLNCSNNKIKIIPENLRELEFLDCSDNELTNFPKLPQLVSLKCWNNLFIKFPGFTDVPDRSVYYSNYSKIIRNVKFPRLIRFNSKNFDDELYAQFNKVMRSLDGVIKY